MGLLVNGQWQDQWYDTEKSGGEFIREDARFRNWVTADGEPGPTGEGGFVAEPGRYQLFVSLACPWAHRTLIFRALKQLQDVISVAVARPEMLENGWEYPYPESVGEADDAEAVRLHYQLYVRSRPDYSGRATVPVLWDRQRHMIVSNESSEIIRMLNSAFNRHTDVKTDYYPPALRDEINTINTRVYRAVNNGVYRCGFATRQEVYERAFDSLFRELDFLEDRLSLQRYLAGDRITESDWRLFTTLIRFDAVYYSHFKCNLRRIEDYHNLSNYVRELYQVAGVAETVNFNHIKRHYFYSHPMINPTRIVPKGPLLDYRRPHDRDTLAANASAAG